MNKKLIPVIAIVVLGLAAGAYYLSAEKHVATATDTVYGNVDIREVTVAFRVAGRVGTVKVDEGDRVKQGDVLATLDTAPLENSLRSSAASVAALAARNALMHEGYRVEDKEQTQARLQSAQAVLTEAERHLARQRELAPEGAATQRALDAAQSARDQATAQIKVLQAQLAQYTRGYRKEEIAESDAQLAQAKANLAIAQLALQDATLRAPSDGVILTRAVENGSMVQVGTPAFSLSLTSPVWVRAYVAEPQLGRFAPGRKVTLRTDARPDTPYHGVVGYVSPSAEFTPKSVETSDLRTALVYRLRVIVEDADEQLRRGMPVTVRLAP
jgi:HlyD family secretion protein